GRARTVLGAALPGVPGPFAAGCARRAVAGNEGRDPAAARGGTLARRGEGLLREQVRRVDPDGAEGGRLQPGRLRAARRRPDRRRDLRLLHGTQVGPAGGCGRAGRRRSRRGGGTGAHRLTRPPSSPFPMNGVLWKLTESEILS